MLLSWFIIKAISNIAHLEVIYDDLPFNNSDFP